VGTYLAGRGPWAEGPARAFSIGVRAGAEQLSEPVALTLGTHLASCGAGR